MLILERRESHEVRPTFALVFCWSVFPVPCIPFPGYQDGVPVTTCLLQHGGSPEFRAAEEAAICMAGYWGGGNYERGTQKLRCVSVQGET